MSNSTAHKAKSEPLNRSAIVRWGKRLRRRINPYLKRHSKIGDAPVFDPVHFPWLNMLEANWEDIRDEARQILELRDTIPPISDISPDHAKLDNEKKWRSYFMWGYGYRSDENCARCPKTTALVEQIPGLRTALFSIHEPGMTISPHKGVTASICVAHLGLIIPKDIRQCAIRVADKIVHWEEGHAFVFDDTYKHETWNNTDEERVILLIHADRPLRFPATIIASVFMWGIRHSPFIGDARAKMSDWNVAMEQAEDKRA